MILVWLLKLKLCVVFLVFQCVNRFGVLLWLMWVQLKFVVVSIFVRSSSVLFFFGVIEGQWISCVVNLVGFGDWVMGFFVLVGVYIGRLLSFSVWWIRFSLVSVSRISVQWWNCMMFSWLCVRQLSVMLMIVGIIRMVEKGRLLVFSMLVCRCVMVRIVVFRKNIMFCMCICFFFGVLIDSSSMISGGFQMFVMLL